MPKVLIADPSTQIREVLAAIFNLFGWEHIEARDGEEAIERARRERPDVVLLEVVLPHRDGWDVLKTLFEVRETRDIPVIILSGWPNVHLDQRLGTVRPAGILTKPFRPLALLDEVESVLPNRRPTLCAGQGNGMDESIVIGSFERNGSNGRSDSLCVAHSAGHVRRPSALLSNFPSSAWRCSMPTSGRYWRRNTNLGNEVILGC